MQKRRKCTKCGQVKELIETNFSLRKAGKAGFDSMCKECKRKYDQERYKRRCKA